eukprot:UN05615
MVVYYLMGYIFLIMIHVHQNVYYFARVSSSPNIRASCAALRIFVL